MESLYGLGAAVCLARACVGCFSGFFLGVSCSLCPLSGSSPFSGFGLGQPSIEGCLGRFLLSIGTYIYAGSSCLWRFQPRRGVVSFSFYAFKTTHVSDRTGTSSWSASSGTMREVTSPAAAASAAGETPLGVRYSHKKKVPVHTPP